MALEAMQQEQAILHHLRYNHYPPVHSSFVPIAQKAIELVNAGEYSAKIEMPNGKVLSAAEIVEGLHLDYFINNEEEMKYEYGTKGLPKPIWGDKVPEEQGLACASCGSRNIYYSGTEADPEEVLGEAIRCSDCGWLTDFYEACKAGEK